MEEGDLVGLVVFIDGDSGGAVIGGVGRCLELVAGEGLSVVVDAPGALAAYSEGLEVLAREVLPGDGGGEVWESQGLSSEADEDAQGRDEGTTGAGQDIISWFEVHGSSPNPEKVVCGGKLGTDRREATWLE